MNVLNQAHASLKNIYQNNLIWLLRYVILHKTSPDTFETNRILLHTEL